ncbi:MAG: hypothetical protein AAFY27_10295, partial [Pseudomonadota bacterium]
KASFPAPASSLRKQRQHGHVHRTWSSLRLEQLAKRPTTRPLRRLAPQMARQAPLLPKLNLLKGRRRPYR